MGDQQPGLGALDGFLPILCQTTATTEPCEGAFHDPSAWQNLEALGGVGALDDLQRPASEAHEGAPQLRSGIAAVREHVAQFRSLAAEPGKDPERTVTILNVGGMNLACDQVAAGVSDDMAFSSVDPLARIVAGKGRVFRGFHALTVDNTGCRLHIASCREARVRDQVAIDLGQQCVFRSIRPLIPTTCAHLFRGIRPLVTRCREAVGWGYQV